MRGRASCIALLCLVLATTAQAQMELPPSGDDARIRLIAPPAGQIVPLQTTLGSALTVILPPTELIQSVILGDTTAYQVKVSGPRDALFILPTRPAPNTAMRVNTNLRAYEFVLSSAPDVNAPYLVRMMPPAAVTGVVVQEPAAIPTPDNPATYRLAGNKDLRPSHIHDDGARTYIEWAPSQAIPAIFAMDRFGNEEMVDGHMRGGAYTIDRIYDELVFRIDKVTATARRVMEKPRK
ncbi:MAG: hypothetical protein RLY97_307 [Pseudomonadota bacterium]|jgi:type IV secretion system protein VirB9